jgi:hypothetical protein
VKSPSPLDEAMDNTNLVITTGGPANWFPQTTVTHDGVDAARSGAITDGQTTWMQAAVTGPGTLSFWWKASCEDDPDADSWDCLLFTVDGVEQHRLDGITDWSAVTCTLGAGAHALRWEYRKDETLLAGEDCAWVDQLVFNQGLPQTATTTTPVPVPYSWLDQFPTLMSDAGGDYEAAALADVDGDGHAAWQEFVAGSIPTNRESVLRTRISAAGGAPCVTWTPDLGAERAYDVEGRSSVLDGGWGPTNDASRFLRVKVRMP